MKYACLLVFTIVMLSATGCIKQNEMPRDRCAYMKCENGGTCYRSECSCQWPYEGYYCERKKILKGSIKFLNLSVDSFYFFINGDNKGVLPGHGYIFYTAETGTNYCRVLQESGYTGKPIDTVYSVQVEYDQITQLAFPQ